MDLSHQCKPSSISKLCWWHMWFMVVRGFVRYYMMSWTYYLICFMTTAHSHTPTVSRVGFLFEWYMTTCASFTQFRKYRTAAGEARAMGVMIPQDQQNQFISLNQHNFTGWLLFHVSSTGTNARRQMFYLTFLMQYHGLSREGIELCADIGYCQRLRTFDDSRNEALQTNTNRIR
jgi:hypothetical protein